MIKESLWEEMKKARTYAEACLFYTDKQRKKKRTWRFVFMTILLIGLSLFSIDPRFTFAVAAISLFRDFIEIIRPEVMQSEEELMQLDGISEYYMKELSILEQLWIERSQNADSYTLARLTKLRQEASSHEVKMNKLLKKVTKKEQDNLDKEVNEYFKTRFYEK